jgi:hypothetical protein
MKRNIRNLCFAMLGTLCTIFAGAQISGSLSQPLDSNLSAVAPTTSTEIEPGANSLLTPDEHVLPYDSIGASLNATLLSADVTQYNTLSRMPFQIDNSVRDATLATGLHTQTPINVVELIERSAVRTGSSSSLQTSSSLVNPFSTSAASSLEGKSALMGSGLKSDVNTAASTWRIGSMGSSLAIDPLPPPPTPPAPLKLVGEETPQGNEKATGQSGSGNVSGNRYGSGSANASGSRYSSRSGNRPGSGSGQDAGSSPADQEQDYSRSPLETVTSSSGSSEGETQNSSSPFKQLGQESFLNPDITSASPRPRTSSSSYQSSSYQSSLRSSSMNSRKSLLSGHSLNSQNGTNPISPDEARLMRHNLSEQRSKRKKWHNPILQQMEDNANPNQ